jgi:hypothetical protein
MTWRDYPHPAVREFLERVRRLPANARAEADPIRDSTWSVIARLNAELVVRRVQAWFASRVLVRLSWEGCRDRHAILEYQAFFRELRRAGWGATGVARVAQSFAAVRAGDEASTKGLRYDRALARVVPRPAMDRVAER